MPRLGWMVAGFAAALAGASGADISQSLPQQAIPLIDAVKSGDKARLRALLPVGVKVGTVNAAQGDGATALHWASYRDDLESADLLIRAGANVNAANDLGVTPLWNASQNGSVAMVKRLLDAGANPNAKLESGETIVMIAARSGKADIVEQLAAKGADVNARASRGQTALMWAAAQQHPDAVKALLAHGAEVNARSETYGQVWQTTLDQDVHPDYKVIIWHGGDTALLFAARQGDLASARLLVAKDADVNDKSAYGTSALVLAAHSGNAELVEFLLKQGANPNAADAGYTALHAAILRRNTQAVEALLDHGADPNAKLRVSTPTRRQSEDFYFHPAFVGATPIWLAARYCEPEVMRLLAQHGADALYVHHVEFWGTKTKTGDYIRQKPGATTALMAAVGLGRGGGFRPLPSAGREAQVLAAAKIAVELGVPVDAADNDGRTALEAATALKYPSVVDFLTAQGAKLDRPARPMRRDDVEN